ncbi:hypothetical protein CRG98_014793 [Punica granatum]|uniref:Uncharacterized protein n=1 Tax=Punica granatum TaxID=22663 RepID=A0A2I0K8C5_PUNGR|nr:hypothetical protein CRG98_014793 [Punica granatum]
MGGLGHQAPLPPTVYSLPLLREWPELSLPLPPTPWDRKSPCGPCHSPPLPPEQLLDDPNFILQLCPARTLPRSEHCILRVPLLPFCTSGLTPLPC